MAETYCGKSCIDCASRHELDCPGCKYGPGMKSGGCSIAVCCIEHGHSGCHTCTKMSYCQTIKAKYIAPEFRLTRLAAQKAEAEELARRAPILADNLWVLFWTSIASMIVSFIDQLLGSGLFGTIVGLAVSAVTAFCYWRMRALSEYYKKTFYCLLASIVISIFIEILSGILELESMGFVAALLLIPTIVIGFYTMYFEFNGHSEQTRTSDPEISDKWLNIWKWYIYAIAAMVISFVIFLIFNIMGMLLLLASVIGILVVSILQLKYLYDTAYLFRDIAESNNRQD